MSLNHLAVSFSNTTTLNGVRDSESFLYLNTVNSGVIHFQPNKKATFVPGTIVRWSGDENFNPSGTVIYLFGLNSILSGWDWGRIAVGSGWILSLEQDAEHGQYLVLAPTSRHVIEKDGHLPLPIDALKVSGGSDHPAVTLTFLYYNVEGITGTVPLNHKSAHVSVALRQPPDVGPLPTLTEKLGYHCHPATVDAFGAEPHVAWIKASLPGHDAVTNTFTVDIGPATDKTPATAGTNTNLILSFVTADTEYGALAARADLANIRVTPDEGAGGWTIIPRVDEQTAYWKIIIPAGRPLRGRLRFDNVTTYLEPGWSDLLVQYRNVPGYRDGQFDGRLYKYGPPYPANVSFTIVKSKDHPSSEVYLRYSWDGFEPMDIYLLIIGRKYSMNFGTPRTIPDVGIINDAMLALSSGGDEAFLRAEVKQEGILIFTRDIGSVPIPIIYV